MIYFLFLVVFFSLLFSFFFFFLLFLNFFIFYLLHLLKLKYLKNMKCVCNKKFNIKKFWYLKKLEIHSVRCVEKNKKRPKLHKTLLTH